jgi:hypothetical protein
MRQRLLNSPPRIDKGEIFHIRCSMTNRTQDCLGLSDILVLATIPVFAHHSFSPDLEWNWTVELGSPAVPAKYGWLAYLVKVGDKIIVDGWFARDGMYEVSARTIKVK